MVTLPTTPADALTSFAAGIAGLFKGNMSVFMEGMLGALVLIGIFLIVYSLMYFVFRVTLMKDQSHSKYAQMIAIGIALLASASKQIYTFIANLVAGAFLTIIVLLFVGFVLVIFINKMRAESAKTGTSMYQAMTTMFSARAEYQQARRELIQSQDPTQPRPGSPSGPTPGPTPNPDQPIPPQPGPNTPPRPNTPPENLDWEPIVESIRQSSKQLQGRVRKRNY